MRARLRRSPTARGFDRFVLPLFGQVFMRDTDQDESEGEQPHEVELRPGLVRIAAKSQRGSIQPLDKKRTGKE